MNLIAEFSEKKSIGLYELLGTRKKWCGGERLLCGI
jgi:hypothetical protein